MTLRVCSQGLLYAGKGKNLMCMWEYVIVELNVGGGNAGRVRSVCGFRVSNAGCIGEGM